MYVLPWLYINSLFQVVKYNSISYKPLKAKLISQIISSGFIFKTFSEVLPPYPLHHLPTRLEGVPPTPDLHYLLGVQSSYPHPFAFEGSRKGLLLITLGYLI